MNYNQLIKDHNIIAKELCEVCNIHPNTSTKLKKGKKVALELDFFTRFKKWKPEIDLKKYFPDYRELIELELEGE